MCRQLKAFDFRQPFWQELALNLGNYFQFMLELIFLALNFTL